MSKESREVQPIFILPEGTQRSTGRTAQRTNIMAAKLVAETIRTTLGPKGMDKMIVDSLGDVTITNDGVTILEEMQISHPAAKMLVEVAKTQEDEVGDGTTTAVVLAGELLAKAEDLIEMEIHPTVIAKGYRMAAEHAQAALHAMSEPITIKDTPMLLKIATTAMTGKGAEASKEKLADLTVKAIKSVSELEGDRVVIDRENIKIEKKVGGTVEDTELVKGIVLDKEKVHPGMPRHIQNAKIALIDSALEIKNTEIDAKIQITDPSQLQSFLDMEEKMLKGMVDRIEKSGANVVFCQKGIDDLAQHFLAKRGIYAARRIKKSDMEKLALATGAQIVTKLDDLASKDLGHAGLVEEVKMGDEDMTFVRECKNPKSVTVLIKGGTEHVVDEVKRAMEDAIGDVAAALKVGKVVAGAGATEMELSRSLRKFSDSLSGREQLAVRAFADAMETIPRTLAENAGLDPIDVLTELKSAHDKDKKWAGINVFTGKVMDAWKEGVIEPLNIKTQAVTSSAEVATMILRIDDVIAGGSGEKGGMPPGGMGGHGGMGGGMGDF
ncbi:TCP-1/cpn60 chaperonin family protein [Candidatus Woesearchaeota archaeon]|nr:TCP-1/cpn60 chaperonin family protein [Candidatus Woesearchaeota archaeon]